MAMQEKLLGQVRENSTNDAAVYTLPASTTAVIKSIVICNQSGGYASFRLYADNSDTTYTQSNALYYDVGLNANETLQIDTYYALSTAGGSIGYRSSVANALTCTIFGVEIT